MTAGPVNLTVDAARPGELARFWAALLGWPELSSADPGGQYQPGADQPVVVRPPDGDGCGFDLVFVREKEPKLGKNRLHLDLASRTVEHQREVVERALRLGARRHDVGQGEVPWVVLADPGGNEFCVLEPRAEYERAGAIAALVVDSREPGELAEFWSARTGWPVTARNSVIVTLRGPSGRGPAIEFLRSDDVKRGRNRIRARLPGHSGADPEGNEFA